MAVAGFFSRIEPVWRVAGSAIDQPTGLRIPGGFARCVIIAAKPPGPAADVVKCPTGNGWRPVGTVNAIISPKFHRGRRRSLGQIPGPLHSSRDLRKPRSQNVRFRGRRRAARHHCAGYHRPGIPPDAQRDAASAGSVGAGPVPAVQGTRRRVLSKAKGLPVTCDNGHQYEDLKLVTLRDRAQYTAHNPMRTHDCPVCGAGGTVAAGTYYGPDVSLCGAGRVIVSPDPDAPDWRPDRPCTAAGVFPWTMDLDDGTAETLLCSRHDAELTASAADYLWDLQVAGDPEIR